MNLFRKIGVRLLLVAISSLLTLALAEVGLRLFRPVQYLKPPDPARAAAHPDPLHRRSSLPGLSYEMIPGKDGVFEGMHVRTSSLGMRGPEPLPSGPDLYRVVVLGDSFTFGFGEAEEDTYPAVLARLLNGSPPGRTHRFEVLNLGVVGYTTRDEAIVLEHRALPLEPRLVIVGYVLNDPETDPRPSLHKHFDRPVWWRRFHVLRLLHLGWNWVDIWRYGGGDYFRYLHAPGRDKWRSVVEGFDSIRRSSEKVNARVLVVIFPFIDPARWAHYPYRDLHARVAEAARSEGFDVVDLLPVFSAHAAKDLRLSTEDGHPSRLAHDLAAHAIADALLPALASPSTSTGRPGGS